MKFENSDEFAKKMDQEDQLAKFREQFLFPKAENGKPGIYLCGNSLGLQPKKAREYINEELDDWAKFGVEGHLSARHPWLPYHEFVTEPLARLVGAKPVEVVAMNTLTVNVHLMMISFYRPTKERFKILIEAGAFPSDQYAVASQAKMHGFDPKLAVIEAKPRVGEMTLRTEDIIAQIEREKPALVMLGSVNYLTGQAFDIPAITMAAHEAGARVGFDLAHGAGNLEVKLHDWGPDFATWCSYKYMNSGPGAIAGAFIHERHAKDSSLTKLAGWWGHDKKTRFRMGPEFHAIPGAESWQLSNPPIFQLAALRASLELFDQAQISKLRAKSIRLTGYLEWLLDQIPNKPFDVITPRDPEQRGCQLSLKARKDPKGLLKSLNHAGVFCDFREPDIVRVAPTPLYNSFGDVFEFARVVANG